MYVTRIQKARARTGARGAARVSHDSPQRVPAPRCAAQERFASHELYEKSQGVYVVTKDTMALVR